MKNTFYRPEEININELDSIVSKMRKDLSELLSGKADEVEVKEYVRKLVSDHKLLEKNTEMAFWGLDEPHNMPSDGRVMFFYLPSYIAVSFLANAFMLNPQIADGIDGFDIVFKKGLLGVTGRNFDGHGIEAFEGLLDTMELFVEANMQKFIILYPDYCTEFTTTFDNALQHIINSYSQGKTFGSWGEDYSKRIATFIERQKGGVQ